MPRFVLQVNGDAKTVEISDPGEPLLYVLRNTLGLTGAALLAKKPDATLQEAKDALAGNLCRCGTHQRILRAMRRAAGRAVT